MGRPNSWSLFILAIVLLVGTPVFTIILQLFRGGGDTWSHIVETLLLSYMGNSLLLVFLVSIISLILGISAAWVVSITDFPGRKFFEWALILPLAIPTYIAAFAYVGLFDYSSYFQQLMLKLGLPYLDIMNLWGLSWVMSLVLYPYVYVVARTAFLNQSQSLLESARILGVSSWKSFYKIAIPVARPAIIGGLTLVVMEVLNDYGAVKYFGISTFTTGIFRAWFSLGDANSAVNLSAILLVFVLFLIYIERIQRGKASFDGNQKSAKPLKRYQLSNGKQLIAFLICLIPFLGGFILPLYKLILWSTQTAHKIVNWDFILMIINSFTLASVAALICVFLSVLLIYSVKLNSGMVFRSLAKVATMGYSIPGAVIAIGIMIPFIFIDNFLINLIQHLFDHRLGLILSGTLFALTFAYIVRFIAVAYNPLDGGFKKTGPNIEEASRSLGAGSWRTLLRVYFPVIRNVMLSAAILVFVDVLKELPLTLILRPFNFHTLATKAYDLASDEMIAESANPALIIILVGIIPIIIMSKMISKTGAE